MKAKEIIDESKWGLLGKLLQKSGSAAKAAVPIAGKIIGAAARNPIKSTAAAATAYNYFKDPDRANKDLPTAIGGALGKTARQAWDLGSAAVSSAFKDGDTAAATTPSARTDSTQAVKPSSNKPEKEFAHGDDQPVRAPDPDSDTNSGSYVRDMERRIEQRYKSWPGQQNESVKKKIKLDEDDATQQAFMDAIRSAESGGRNIKNAAGSSAYGHYQFLKSTAQRMARDPRNRNTPIYGKSWEDYKRDPDLQREFMKVATQNYTKIYQQNKVPVTGGTLYMAHHFGPDMAVKMHKAGPEATMSNFYPEYVTKKNPITGQPEKVRNPVYVQNPAIKPNQTVQYTHDRLDTTMAKRDKSNTLATLDKKNLWTGTGIATVAATTTLAGVPKGGGAKPSSDVVKPSSDVVKPMRGPNGEPLVQMPDFSLGFKVGDKFVPQTRQGYGQPIDYAETHAKAKSSMGISPDEALRQSNDELLARRAAVQRGPTRSIIEPVSVVPKTPAKEPEKKPESTANVIPPFSMTNTPTEPEVRKPDGAWDKFINTVTVGRVPPEEKERMQVPESINKEIQDILRLSGKQ